MGIKRAYLAILRSHVDEKLSIARIIRSRLRRKLAELELKRDRRLAGARRAWSELRLRLSRAMARAGIGRGS